MKVKRSGYFIPFKKQIKESEFDGAIEKMFKGGFIHKTSSGIYAWLPLGLKSLEKAIKIIEKAHEKYGVIKMLAPLLHNSDIWKATDRYNFGEEMLKLQDRKGNELIFAPTAEEMFCDIISTWQYNKNAFPLNIYNIQWKFRDEIRPRYGVIRGREFLMKDAYSFNKNRECLLDTYKKMFCLYSEIFTEIGFEPVTLSADVGLMGGFMSHEFLVKSAYGETTIELKKAVSKKIRWEEKDYAYEVESGAKYAEIGHIYALGDKYTKIFNLRNPENNEYLMMGSYGIGISRILGLMFEKENLGALAPFDVTLLQISKSTKCKEFVQKIFDKYDDIIWDDREEISVGSKYAEADLIGSPLQIIVAEEELKNDEIIIKQNGEKKKIKISEIL